MRLFENSWDGDVEGVKCILGTEVPVDVQDQVRHNFIILGIRMRNMPRARCIVQCTCNGKKKENVIIIMAKHSINM